jgi:hypothetical protein
MRNGEDALTRGSSTLPAHGRARRDRRRLAAALWLGLLLAPAPVLAQRVGGGKVMLFLLAGPMVIPAIGIVLASLGLRITRASLLWGLLCGMLAVNAALLGGLFALAAGEASGVIPLIAHLALAGAMLFTFPRDRSESKAKLVLTRMRAVLACGVLPTIVTSLLFQ